MTAPEIAGLAIVGVGLVLMLVAMVAALRESRMSGRLSAAADFIDALRKLVEQLANGRTSLVLFAFGTIMVFLGGVVVVGGDLLA